MTSDSLERKTEVPQADKDKIVQVFIDSGDRNPKPLSDLAKPFGEGAYRFARTMEEIYRDKTVRPAPLPEDHPLYKFNPDTKKI